MKDLSIKLQLEYVYETDLDGNIEDEVIKYIKNDLKNYHKSKTIKFEIIDLESYGGWPLIEFIFKNIQEAYDFLDVFSGGDIDIIIEELIIALCNQNRCQEIFNFIKTLDEYIEIFKDHLHLFKDSFIKKLKGEDLNFINSLKGINKYNL